MIAVNFLGYTGFYNEIRVVPEVKLLLFVRSMWCLLQTMSIIFTKIRLQSKRTRTYRKILFTVFPKPVTPNSSDSKQLHRNWTSGLCELATMMLIGGSHARILQGKQNSPMSPKTVNNGICIHISFPYISSFTHAHVCLYVVRNWKVRRYVVKLYAPFRLNTMHNVEAGKSAATPTTPATVLGTGYFGQPNLIKVRRVEGVEMTMTITWTFHLFALSCQTLWAAENEGVALSLEM